MRETPTENGNELQSSRRYEASPVIAEELRFSKKVFEKPIGPDTKTLLIGDGQGQDTALFLEMGVRPENVVSVNYDEQEVAEANAGALKESGVTMKQADATDYESLNQAGLVDASQDLAVLMHVIEVPAIRGETEKRLVSNLARLLKPGGEVLASQYVRKLSPEEAEILGVEEIRAEDLEKTYGSDWRQKFQKAYGQEWREGMRYSEISSIRSRDELEKLFADDFEVHIEQRGYEYILRMKKK